MMALRRRSMAMLSLIRWPALSCAPSPVTPAKLTVGEVEVPKPEAPAPRVDGEPKFPADGWAWEVMFGVIEVPESMPTISLTSAYFSGTTFVTIPCVATAGGGGGAGDAVALGVAAEADRISTSSVWPGPRATCSVAGSRT